MGSKALYRKHRSKSLDEVVGQQHITDTLKSALKKDAISHAYLFTGPKGVGKTSIARILAHEINKLPYDEETTHLDIIEIDAASNRRIDEIRELRDKVHIAPTSAKYKVYIIDEVHMLTREAFNALLKTLEEPPEHAVFILATTESHKVPDTITSRTQRFIFKPISLEAISHHLKDIAKKEDISISDEALEAIARHGNGSFRDSISMLDQLSGLGKDSFEFDDVSFLLGLPDEESVNMMLSSIEDNDPTQLFNSIQGMKEKGVDVNQTARSLSSRLRNHLIEQKPTVERRTIIRLLKDLLPLTNGPADFVALELCVLDAMDFDTAPKESPSPKIAAPEVAPETVAEKQEPKKVESPKKPEPVKAVSEEEPKSSEPPKQKPSTDEKKAFSSDAWKQLLDDMKGNHNTLYGILRMAQVDQQDGKITLVFKFGFHKKRIESPANNKTLREYITRHFGSHEVTTIVDKAAQEPDETPQAPASSDKKSQAPDDVSSVSNIFGGAELLE